MGKANLNINTAALKDFLVNFIVPLLAFIIVCLLGFFVLYPSFKSIPQLKEDIKVDQAKKQVLDQKKLNLDKLVKFKVAIDENSSIVDKVLVSETMVPELLDQISQIAKEAGLKISRLNYSFSTPSAVDPLADANVPAAPTTEEKYVDVSLGIDGSYDQLINFTVLLENAARYVDISNFRYSFRNETEGTPSALEISFSLTSPYLFVQSAAVTDDPITLDISSKEFITFMNRVKSLRYYTPSGELPPVQPEEVKESTTSEPAQ